MIKHSAAFWERCADEELARRSRETKKVPVVRCPAATGCVLRRLLIPVSKFLASPNLLNLVELRTFIVLSAVMRRGGSIKPQSLNLYSLNIALAWKSRNGASRTQKVGRHYVEP